MRPRTPLAEKFSYQKTVLGHIEMCVKFRLSRSSSFRDMRESQIYTRGGAPPHARNGKIFIPKEVLGPVEMYVKFRVSRSSSFRDMGVINLH